MRVVPKYYFAILSISWICALAGARVRAADAPVLSQTAAAYPHQTSDGVTVGAKVLKDKEDVEEVFKKARFLKYGVLPIYVVIENGRGKTIDLRYVNATLVAADGRHVRHVNPQDLAGIGVKVKNPRVAPMPVPFPTRKINPMNSPEIMTKAFQAQVLPPGDHASGFFYFEAKFEPGDRLYLDGLIDTASNQPLLYAEFPLGEKEPSKPAAKP